MLVVTQQQEISAGPIQFDPAAHAWIASSYQDVTSILLRPDEFSWGRSSWGKAADPDDPVFASMAAADGHRHADLRQLVQRFFAAPRLEVHLGHIIESAVDRLLDEMIARGAGELDIVRDLSEPLAAEVTYALLGAGDPRDADQLRTWRKQRQDAMSAGGSSVMPQMRAYFEALIEQRRQEPGDGLLDFLIDAQRDGYLIDGKPMSDTDLLATVWNIVSPGLTGAKPGPALVCLLENGLVSAARDDARLLTGAFEESMRLYPSFYTLPVRSHDEVDVNGVTIPADAPVKLAFFAANRDPAQFTDPDRFDPARTPNRHLGFGLGAHFCLGAHLARIQARQALQAVLERLPDLHLDPDRPPAQRYLKVFGTRFEAYFRY
jgi:cytochrome P450